MSKRRTAFTLVELLVVIGIIAVLIGILLPALGRARESAKMIACESTLRSLAQSTLMYVSENKGSFPPCFLGWNTPQVTSGNYGNTAMRPFIWDYLEKYGIKSNKARCCTNSYDEIPEITYKDVIGGTTLQNQAFSYHYNAFIGGIFFNGVGSPSDGTYSYTTPLKAGMIKRSSRTVLFADSGMVDTYQTTKGDPSNPLSWPTVSRSGQPPTQNNITDVWFRAEWPGYGGSQGVKPGAGLSGINVTATEAAQMQAFTDTHAVQHYKKVINQGLTVGAPGWNDIPQKGMNNVALADGSCKSVTTVLDRYGALPWGDKFELVLEPRKGVNGAP